jgi:hypothetical protein
MLLGRKSIKIEMVVVVIPELFMFPVYMDLTPNLVTPSQPPGPYNHAADALQGRDPVAEAIMPSISSGGTHASCLSRLLISQLT